MAVSLRLMFQGEKTRHRQSRSIGPDRNRTDESGSRIKSKDAKAEYAPAMEQELRDSKNLRLALWPLTKRAILAKVADQPDPSN